MKRVTTKEINGVTVTVTQAKSNYIWLAVLFILTGWFIALAILFPILSIMFGTIASVCGIFFFAMLKGITDFNDIGV